MARFAGPVRGPLAVAVVLTVAAAMFELLLYWLIYGLVRVVVGTANEHAFFAAAAVGLVAVVGQYALFGAAMTLSHRAAFGMLYEIRMALARHWGGCRWATSPANAAARS